MPEYSNSWMLHFIALYSTYLGVSNTCLRPTIRISGYFILFSLFLGFKRLVMPEYCRNCGQKVCQIISNFQDQDTPEYVRYPKVQDISGYF